MYCVFSYRNLKISTAPTKAKLREPAYSQALIQNKIDRQQVKTTVRQADSQIDMVDSVQRTWDGEGGREKRIRIGFVEEQYTALIIRSVYESESRTPNIRKSRSPKPCRTPNFRKSRSPNVSCEVSRQIGLVIRCKPYSSSSSVIKVFALHVALPRFKSHPRTTFIILAYFF